MTARRIASWTVLTAAIIPASGALAHHGDAGRYEDAITTLSGTVVALQLINPHSLILVDVIDESTGKPVRWQVEVSNANGLARIGWTKETLKPGDEVTMWGRVLKSGAPYINLSERSRLVRTQTCEVLYESGMIYGERPDYPPPSCD